ncbi:ABC1 kinase family protein [Microbacterium sp. NPDC058345]|uniref:ABC1 kinase family protein n=1 Tax=Microbacterium sp. NPDC058345 TaxID=3346455 RepID=UPI00365ACB99
MLATIFASVLVCGYVIALGLVVRWLLGAPIGAVRTVLAGVVGFFLVLPAAFLAAGATAIDAERLGQVETLPGDVAVVLVSALWVLALSAAFVVASELLWPSRRSVGLLARLRGWRDRLRRTARYVQIVRIAMRHGLGPLLRGGAVRLDELGPPLVSALNEAGVAFVKLGQVLASRRDVVPAALADRLATLQTQAVPESWDDVGALLQAELGRPPSDVFAHLDPIPLAAASIGQVHVGTLADGQEVVVKVQRPRARAQVEVDIDIALRVCRRIEARSDDARRAGLHRLMDELAASLRAELDYRVEGRNLALMRSAATRGRPRITIPRVHLDASTRRVLIMERVAGTPLTSAASVIGALPALRRREVAAELIDVVLQQILIDGVFHADLHSGNILIDGRGELALIDFGSVAVLDREQRELLVCFFSALRAEDARSAVVAVRHLTLGRDAFDDHALRRDIGELFTLTALEPDTAVLSDRLLRLLHRHGLAVPGNLAAAVRTLATLQDAVASLDPGSDYADLILDRVGDTATRTLDPRRLPRLAAAQAMALGQYLRRLPGNLDILTEAHTASARSSGARESSRRGWRLRILTVLSGCAFGALLCAAAFVLLLQTGGPSLPPGVAVLPLVGAVLGSAGLIIGLRSVIALHRLSSSTR